MQMLMLISLRHWTTSSPRRTMGNKIKQSKLKREEFLVELQFVLTKRIPLPIIQGKGLMLSRTNKNNMIQESIESIEESARHLLNGLDMA